MSKSIIRPKRTDRGEFALFILVIFILSIFALVYCKREDKKVDQIEIKEEIKYDTIFKNDSIIVLKKQKFLKH